MAKIVPILLVFGVVVYCTAAFVTKRDVSELLRHREYGQVHYGNGIPGDQAVIDHEYFNIDKAGNYNFGRVNF